ncbi:ABC-type maltose/maltodextrin transporter ATP-binding protein MalK [Mycoplasmopsis canis UFG4]|uniref:ABC-type maltose/maltodextrin transporter ATP-binding protein MalK n=2 Tax=Mycoplasmopsis canis TaxID=29555 RepID=I1A788_9BACT|nr:ABC transporter ATP-binding protein [Mycoplasmopsis canis]AKF41282.1 ABC transporter ATP-binding protein [Mycoplasmopsis canis]AMD81394.1 ABC transporter ATP-binding protein [Mycoplasmopsis canis PG 14]EIE40804.1 ABC-type maltose/maltodextrin transporter ATP-binding protein MalK [Mycoplasmopsis canis UF31]EIE40870.1 ABC-type maltose/maltodextrin transporter ATP-binding protein MalK [Mycoplasmopsis canis PG 14]EIE40933.1 ABC-type maltose/maltodextrin transporter ATP-binding protein MalK [Myc
MLFKKDKKSQKDLNDNVIKPNSELELADEGFETIDIDQMISEVGEVYNSNSGAHIKLVNISKKYEGNEHYTLNNINLEIKPGTFCIFLGPSGCGKTTLLRMIAGLNSITKGDLLFNNKRYNNLLPNERNIAMVFQSYALYPHMNVYNNISFGLKIAKERKDVIDKRVKDVAKILKIDNYLYRKPRDLSGGQRQRVAIGRAIARKPLVFLMDEPLSNLDAKLRENMRREIVNIHRMLNTTSIYVTHDQLEAMTMGDQIVVFNDGKIQQNGKGKELYFKPANVFVAKFIGSPTMNTFDATFKNGLIVDATEKIQISLDEETKSKLLDGQKLVIGFRSEDLRIQYKQLPNSVQGKISNVELIGKDQLVVVKINEDTEFIVNASNSEEFELFSQVYVEFVTSRIHIFDKETEDRIN